MAASIVDLVKINALSTGTGAITLGDAVAGYRGKEALTNGGVYSYAIQQGAEFEVGQGTYLAASNAFVRSPRYSSDGGTAIDLNANAAVAFVLLSEDLATKIFDSTALDTEVSRASSAEAFLASRINTAAAGMTSYATAADLPTSPAPADGTQARVYADSTAANNGVWLYSSGAWAFDTDYYDAVASVVQPLVDEAGASATSAANSAAILYPELSISSSRVFTGTKLIEGSGSITPSCSRAVAMTSGKTYTWQAIAKVTEARQLQLYNSSAAWNVMATFDLQNGTATVGGTGGATATIEPLGNGAYLCTVTATASSTATTTTNMRLMSGSAVPYTGDGASGVHLPWVFFASSDAPTTNLFPSSLVSDAGFTHTSCTTALATITDTPIAAQASASAETLNGSPIKASKLVEASGSVSPIIYHAFTYANDTTYTAWVRAKAGERSRLNLFDNSGAPGFNATIDLARGTITGGTGITQLGNDEYLAWVTFTTTSAHSANFQLRLYPDTGSPPYTGDGASGLYVHDAGICLGTDPNGANLIVSSSAFNTTVWTKGSLTVTPNALTFGSLVAAVLDLYNKTTESNLPLNGRKWAALGDSFTQQGRYPAALVSLSGMVLTNLGIAGQCIGDNANAGSSQIQGEVDSIPDDTEVVTLLAGINDFGDSTPLGALGDKTQATFYGGLYQIIYAIWAKVPDALLFIASPTPGAGSGTYGTDHGVNATNTGGWMVRDYQNAVREVCEWLGVAFTDVGTQCGINDDTGDRALIDGLHPNDALGAPLIANYWYGDMVDKVNRGLSLLLS